MPDMPAVNIEADLGRRHAHLISPALPQSLAAVPHHGSGPLERWLLAGREVHPEANTHIAVHRVGPVAYADRSYCDQHSHTVAEFNLIIPIGASLVYDITLDDERYVVDGPASVHIPAGVRHSANVKHGHGYFIAILHDVEDYAKALVLAREANALVLAREGE